MLDKLLFEKQSACFCMALSIGVLKEQSIALYDVRHTADVRLFISSSNSCNLPNPSKLSMLVQSKVCVFQCNQL